MRKITNEELMRPSVEEFGRMEKMPVVVILDNVRSMQNVGAFFRTGDAFAVEKIILCGITATPPARDIHKTALGAEMTVAWSYCEQTAEAVTRLKEEGYRVLAVEQVEGAVMLNDFRAEEGEICPRFWQRGGRCGPGRGRSFGRGDRDTAGGYETLDQCLGLGGVVLWNFFCQIGVK